MNGIFLVIFGVSALLFLLRNPDALLPALLQGGEKAATVSLSLLASYCVWLGFFEVMQQCGLHDKLSRMLFPLTKRLFRSTDRQALSAVSCNLSANVLGLPGAPTPLGVKATSLFLGGNNEFGANMLFVLNATSLQLLPTTTIALRAAAGSISPSDILLPTLLCTLLSSFLGVLFLHLFSPQRRIKCK